MVSGKVSGLRRRRPTTSHSWILIRTWTGRVSRVPVLSSWDIPELTIIVTVTVHSATGESSPVVVTVNDGDKEVASHKGDSDKQFTFQVSKPKLWSPESPTLYNVTVTLGDDEVQSYTGFRTIAKGEVGGIVRPILNGDFTFMFGTLDQGYWPDGLYTPPNREAMIYDLKVLKELGFNMVRKHVSRPYSSF